MSAEPAPAPRRRRLGRPSKAAAAAIADRILDAATSLFLADGYGATSIEAVALQAGVAKRTCYDRFPDKPTLFAASVHRILGRLRTDAGQGLFDGDDIESVLRRVARAMLQAATSPTVLALHRLLVTEAARFPDLAAAASGEGSAASSEIGALLVRAQADGKLCLDDPEFSAAAFIQLVVAGPQRRALGIGPPLEKGAIEAWADAAVTLFLNGCRTRG